jgi:hypothetical protein
VRERAAELAARVAGLRARLSAATGDPDRALSYFRRAVGGLGPNDPLGNVFGKLGISSRRQLRELAVLG